MAPKINRFMWSGSMHSCNNMQEHAPHVESNYDTPRDGYQSNVCRGRSGPNIHIGVINHYSGSPYTPGHGDLFWWKGFVDPGPFTFRVRVWPREVQLEGRLRDCVLLTDIEQVDGPRKATRSWAVMPMRVSLIPSGTEITIRARWGVHYARKAQEWREGVVSGMDILAPWDEGRQARVVSKIDSLLSPDGPLGAESPHRSGIHANPHWSEEDLVAMLYRFYDSRGLARPDLSELGEVL